MSLMGSGFSIKAILFGLVSGIVLFLLGGFALGIIVALVYGPEALRVSANTEVFLLFTLLLSLAISGLAGWITAHFARINVVGNALAMGVVLLIISMIMYRFISITHPDWYVYTSNALLIPAVVIGAYLQRALNK